MSGWTWSIAPIVSCGCPPANLPLFALAARDARARASGRREQSHVDAQIIVDAAITKRVIRHGEYESLFDKSIAFQARPNRIASVAIAVMEMFALAEPLPNRLLAPPLRR